MPRKGDSKKAAICNPRGELSPDTNAAVHLDLGLLASPPLENKFQYWRPMAGQSKLTVLVHLDGYDKIS